MKSLLSILLAFYAIPLSLAQNLHEYPQQYKILVKGGTFSMGVAKEDIHTVTLNDFYIGKYEVTNGQYIAFLNHLGTNEYEVESKYGNSKGYYAMNSNEILSTGKGLNKSFMYAKGMKDYPVQVSWLGAKLYCDWVGGRLPTEAEWEYSAKGGEKSHGYIYAGSNKASDVAWYYMSDGKIQKYSVGLKQPNELGIYDMSGNMYEWCNDYFEYFDNKAVTNPKGPNKGKYRIVRGGSWSKDKEKCKVTERNASKPISPSGLQTGFRVAFDAN